MGCPARESSRRRRALASSEMEYLYDYFEVKYESMCLCGSSTVEEPPRIAVDEFAMVSMSVRVDDGEQWLEAFEQTQDEHRALGIVKSFVGTYETTEGRFVFNKTTERHVHVVHVFRREACDDVRDLLTCPPYAGATDAVYSNLVTDFEYGDLEDADAMASVHHGVPDFPQWLEEYAARERRGKLADLETTRTLVGEIQPGCAGAHLVHLLRAECVENLSLDFEGDPDLETRIRKGAILRPYGATSSSLVYKRE